MNPSEESKNRDGLNSDEFRAYYEFQDAPPDTAPETEEHEISPEEKEAEETALRERQTEMAKRQEVWNKRMRKLLLLLIVSIARACLKNCLNLCYFNKIEMAPM